MKVVLLCCLVSFVAGECCWAYGGRSYICCKDYFSHCNIFCCNCDLPCSCGIPGSTDIQCTPAFCRKQNVFGGDVPIVNASTVFNKADTNKDGKLSTSEVQVALNLSNYDGFTADFKKMDLNNDGFVQPIEFDKDFH